MSSISDSQDNSRNETRQILKLFWSLITIILIVFVLFLLYRVYGDISIISRDFNNEEVEVEGLVEREHPLALKLPGVEVEFFVQEDQNRSGSREPRRRSQSYRVIDSKSSEEDISGVAECESESGSIKKYLYGTSPSRDHYLHRKNWVKYGSMI